MPDRFVGAAQEIRLIRPIRPMSKRCAAIFYPRVLTMRCFYPHGLFLAAQMSDRSDKSDRSDIKPPPQAAVIPQRVYRMCCIAGHA